MELHSYAKRRMSKKWDIHQKRQLVETRIRYDGLFQNCPNNSVLPWKNILALAKLGDYNVYFVRKQWASMVDKYKTYKNARLRGTPSQAIDNELIDKITQEWEFFRPIHEFMTRKTTNLHSYAQTAPSSIPSAQEQQELMQHLHSNSSNDHPNTCSSDTNDVDYAHADFIDPLLDNKSTPIIPTNTDHDFYSKKHANANAYYGDASEDTQDAVQLTVLEAIKKEIMDQGEQDHEEMTVGHEQVVETKASQTETVGSMNGDIEPSQATNGVEPLTPQRTGSRELSERDKYYRHKRRFNHRMEKRFDGLLNVVAQIAKTHYSNVNVAPLMQVATAIGDQVVRTLVSDDSDGNSSDDSHGEAEEQRHPKHTDSPPRCNGKRRRTEQLAH